MDYTETKQALSELTMMLIYLSRFKNNDRLTKSDDEIAWKGYDFDILNELDDKEYIFQGNHPSRSKYVYLTESGKDFAKELLKKYGIENWE